MTIDNIKERFLSTFLAILIAIVNYKFYFSLKIDMKSFMEKSIDISSISFGFLLAVLALLLQSDTSAINRIKQNGRFDELINFNKKAVIASAILAIAALLYVSLNIDTDYVNSTFYNSVNVRHIVDSITLALFVFQVAEVYLFLDLFYILIKL